MHIYRNGISLALIPMFLRPNHGIYRSLHDQLSGLCVQVISAELNRVVVELLQQLLFWQERQKAQDPLKATKKKRLVSGLR